MTYRLTVNLLILFILFLPGCTPKTSKEFCKAGQRKMFTPKTRPLADSLFREAIRLDSSNHQAYFLLGDMYRMQWGTSKNPADLSNCRIYYEKAILMDRSNCHYWYFLGDTYEKEGVITSNKNNVIINQSKLIEAVSCYNKSILIDSSYEPAYYGRAYCYNYLGDSISAFRDLKKSCELGNGVSCLLLEVHKK